MDVSISNLVDERLNKKDKNAHIHGKCIIQSDGSRISSINNNNDNNDYMKEHNIISNNNNNDNKDPELISFNPALWIQRICKISKIIEQYELKTIIDYGCGSGKFIKYLGNNKDHPKIFYGIDIDKNELYSAENYCSPIPGDYLHKREYNLEIKLYQGSILEPENFLKNQDALVCIEVMEHILRPQADELGHIVFGFLRPKIAIFSTPNSEYNVVFTGLETGKFRHWDHKFEMTRKQFQDWGNTFANRYNYKVGYTGVGDQPLNYSGNIGYCTQIAVFECLGDSINDYLPSNQNLKLINHIIYPIQEKKTKDIIYRDIESELDYYYRVHCKQINNDNTEYNIWVNLEYISNIILKKFSKISQNDIIKAIEISNLFEYSTDKISIRGTHEYIKLNDPMEYESDNDDDYY